MKLARYVSQSGTRATIQYSAINIVSLYILFIFTILLQSCVTRKESDTFTIVIRDTTTKTLVQNAPGERPNGVVFPSSTVISTEHSMTMRDSVVDRFYPNFIRLGLFESAGFVATSSGNNGLGSGLFGVFGLFDPNYAEDISKLRNPPKRDVTFTGGLYRFGVGEWRLRWFRDSKNWTIGTSVVETIIPEARLDQTLLSVFPLYIRKRYFLKETIPYVAVTPTVGIGYFPSQYINLGGSLDVGSIGGLNIRAYIGYATGINLLGFMLNNLPNTPTGDRPQSATASFPYAGLGVSVLDFLNIVPETYKEWKDHEHSSWNVGLIQAAILNGSAAKSIYGVLQKGTPNEREFPVSGAMIRFANAHVILPFYEEVLQNRLYLGTSLFNLVSLGKNETGLGILPIRLGFWQPVLLDELNIEPFVEYNYFPSSFTHLGAKLNLYITNRLTAFLNLGYASGTSVSGINSDLVNQFGQFTQFSGTYLGFGVGISDRIFFTDEVRYNRK